MSATSASELSQTSKPWIAVAVVLVWLATCWLADYRCAPPRPQPSSTPATEFSAERAKPILIQVFGDEIPHPAGSQQNEAVRNRIVELLRAYDYEVEIQTGEGSVNPKVRDRSPDRPVVPIANVLTRLRGGASGDSANAIMLVAHYDSVPFGPGISDDGVGTAVVLEIARMLSRESIPARDVIFLLSDGEEFGLLGAKMFVDSHPWADDVGLVINLEARGTDGPSLMFQTSPNSRSLIPLFARASRRPATSSLFFEIYQRLPRDTDFTIFNRAGMSGYNFAFIGNALDYHTGEDDLSNFDLGSMQHHGDQALGLIREWMVAPVDSNRDGKAVYFDFFGWMLVWWPASVSLWISLVSLLLIVTGQIFSVSAVRGSRETIRRRTLDWLTACLKIVASIVLVFLIGWVLTFLASLDQEPQPAWSAYPLPMLLGYWLSGITVLLFLNGSWLARVSVGTTLSCILLIWSAFAIATSCVFNGGSHLFVVPALAGGLAVVGLSRTKLSEQWLALLFPIVVGLMWLPLEGLIYDAVGFRMPVLNVVRITIVTSSLIPALRWVDSTTSFYWAIASSVVTTISFVIARLLA